MATPSIKRVYGSRQKNIPSRVCASSLTYTSAPTQKRPLEEQLSFGNIAPSSKRTKTLKKAEPRKPGTEHQGTLTQLHFCIDQSILRTCPQCDMSYTKGAPDDETLHRAHCARVQKGMEWGREEEKETTKYGVTEIRSGIKLKDGRKGRIICFRADVGGKIGSKLTTLLRTVNLALSSPPLTSQTLQASKAYLFLVPAARTTLRREKIAGCAIAQRISVAMTVASPQELSLACQSPSQVIPTAALVTVDASTGLFCHPEPLPTPLGIPRLFVSSIHRRYGIASKLLSAAAETFIVGCPLDPRKGQVAFTQPTGDGYAIMCRWGGGGVRIYEE